MKHDDDDQKIRALLRELTEWQRESGLPVEGHSDVRSTGESAAAIEELKRQLDELGAHYHWSKSAQEYRLVPDARRGDADDCAGED